jgi:methionyl-tRNA formyltransferase
LKESIQLLRDNDVTDICILKCTSCYPTPIEESNLITIKDIQNRFNVITGLSDHTNDIEVPIASVCLGACIIEKHLMLHGSDTLDSSFSLDQYQFKSMVESIRRVEKALGKIQYCIPTKKQLIFRKSLFVSNDIKKGEMFTDNNIKSVRPSYGLHTRYYNKVIGKFASRDLKYGSPLLWDMIDNPNFKVLYLGNQDNQIVKYMKSIGDNVTCTMNKITKDYVKDFDFIVSYGYRHIIRGYILDQLPNRVINLHISFLPFNRGADPNFWSIVDNTIKGVTIHYMDEGIDTGDIIVQSKVDITNSDTMKTSYNKLKDKIEQLFIEHWIDIKNGQCPRIRQNKDEGTYHRMKDKPNMELILDNGWDTNIQDVINRYNTMINKIN